MRRLAGSKELREQEAFFFSRLQELIQNKKRKLDVKGIACVDCSYSGENVCCVSCLVSRGKVIDTAVSKGECRFPYVSGLFYLREGPYAVDSVRRLSSRPSLACFNAHGLIKPGKPGMAFTCGAVLGLPSIGVAGSILLGEEKGTRIVYGKRTLGYVVNYGKRKTYWTPGYMVSLFQLKKIISLHLSEIMNGMLIADRISKSRLVS